MKLLIRIENRDWSRTVIANGKIISKKQYYYLTCN